MRLDAFHLYIVMVANSLILYGMFLSLIWRVVLSLIGIAILGFYCSYGMEQIKIISHEKEWNRRKRLNDTETMI